MAKPRIFVSSTYYDLKHIRNSLEAFIEGLGYDAVLFESGDIPFRHDTPIDESCYVEIQSCHMLVLIIGGRYGSPSSEGQEGDDRKLDQLYEQFNSITKKEYEEAIDRDIPVFIFVDKNVRAEYQTYKENKNNDSIAYAHVDSKNIFKLLDNILTQHRNNYIKDFEKFDDIANWLRDQWAGLFADFLSKKSAETTLKDLSSQISDLKELSGVLKKYTESIGRKIQPSNFPALIKEEEKRLRLSHIQRFARHPMIRFLRDAGPKKATPSKLYDAFKGSESIEEFLKKASFPVKFIHGFIEKNEKRVEKDYDAIKLKFFIDEDEDKAT